MDGHGSASIRANLSRLAVDQRREGWVCFLLKANGQALVAAFLLVRLDQDFLHQLRPVLEFGFAGREMVHAEHVGQDVGFGLAADFGRIVSWHGDANSLEQNVQREAIPA